MTSEIHIELTGRILAMTLARPERKNALTNAMYGTLADAIERAQEDRGIRVLLLRGDGDMMFTAGKDKGDFAAMAAGKGPTEKPGPRARGGFELSASPAHRTWQGLRDVLAGRSHSTG